MKLNGIEYVTKDTHRLLPGRNLWPPVEKKVTRISANLAFRLCVQEKRQFLPPPAQTAIGLREPYDSDSRSRDGSSGQKARASSITPEQGDSGRAPKHTHDRVKNFHSIHPTFGQVKNLRPINPYPQNGQVQLHIKSTEKSATRPTDVYTR